MTTPYNWNLMTENDPPKDGSKVLLQDADGDIYIGWWTDDVYTHQSGSGGPSGWFSGKYRDNWGDYPVMERPVFWQKIPEAA
jgi:hypothetical protein